MLREASSWHRSPSCSTPLMPRVRELYFLAAKRWREALAEVLPELLPGDEAAAAGRSILRENGLRLYRLG